MNPLRSRNGSHPPAAPDALAAASAASSSASGTREPRRAASLSARVLAQARYETVTMVRNGEQFLLLVVLPLIALVALHVTGLLDAVVPSGHDPLDVAVAGVLVLCVLSAAFSGQGIQTGFDRRYGVLRQMSTTPLGRTGLVAGKLLAVLAVLAVQYLLIGVVAALLGWRPGPGAVLESMPLLVLTAIAFTGLGLLIAGTLRAEATLAVLNLVWVVLAAGGGVLFPVSVLPGPLEPIVALLPSAAAGDLLRACFTGSALPLAALVVLLVWALLGWLATVRFFRWN